MKLRNGRGWAYAGAWLGGALSIAGNVHNSFVPPDNAPASWSPTPGAVIVSAAWPIALVIVAEVVIRTPWPKAWHWVLLRLAGLIPVGVVSGVVSFRHLRDLLAYFGEDKWIQNLGPIAVDGLMITCAAALFATAVHRTGVSVDTDSVPLAVRLAGQFATVRELLSTDKVSARTVSEPDTDTAVQPERTEDTDTVDLSEILDKLCREEDGEPDTDSVSMDNKQRTRDEIAAILERDSQADKPRPVSLSLAERVSAVALAFPDRIPLGREVKAELGITSQGVVTDVLRELKTRRAASQKTEG